MFKERKLSVKCGLTLGSLFGFLMGLMLLFILKLDNAPIVCIGGLVFGLIAGLLINGLYNLEYNRRI